MTNRTKLQLSEGALTTCALVLAVGLGVMLGPVLHTEARAEMVSESDHLVTMTAKGGNEDVLLVIDNRSEQLMVYKVNQQNAVDLLQRVELPKLFEAARARRTGSK
ncbi:MAG: hypothetical protein IPJ41_00755 [Phycisphaerales bacterium]|nr:hypothetical protein [Phycisphaerales bacterium]